MQWDRFLDPQRDWQGLKDTIRALLPREGPDFPGKVIIEPPKLGYRGQCQLAMVPLRKKADAMKIFGGFYD